VAAYDAGPILDRRNPPAGMPQGNRAADREVAVMRFVQARVRGARIWRGFVIPAVGLLLTGCAAVTKDVDAYYRQMAINYGEAIEKAKLDEASLRSRAQVLGMTGEPRAARNAQRELRRIESWEEHCSREKQRFEKAARWMETHFDAVGKAVALEKYH